MRGHVAVSGCLVAGAKAGLEPHPPPASYASKITGRYEHCTITGGIGHNLPQEAPEAFVRAA